jgi:uncharacterized protein YndB with AHSA1/START domain
VTNSTEQSPEIRTWLRLRRTFNAAPEQVFRAWTEPEALQQWFKPLGHPVSVVALDLRVGGAYRFEMHLPDGERSPITGTYLEIVRPEKLVFTWCSGGTNHEETLVSVEFIDRGDATEIILTHERLADDAMETLHRQGWESVFEQLGAYWG